MRLGTLLRAGALTLAFAAVGCGDSTGPAITLNTNEVNNLFDEIGGVLSPSSVFDRTAPGLSLSRVPRIDLNSAANVSESFACPNGGNATVSGTSTLTSGAAGSADVTAAFSSCKTSHYTLGGSFTANVSVTVSGTSVTVNQTAKGDVAVTVTADARTGNCHVDFTLVVVTSGSTGLPSTTVSGTVCGMDAKGISSVQ